MQATIPNSYSPYSALITKLGSITATQNYWFFAAIVFGLSIFLTLSTRPDVAGPIHVDEWTHLAYAETLVKEQSLPHSDPLFGESEIEFRPETGFRVFLAQLKIVTGLDWASMFPLLPAIMAAVFATTVLALGRSLRLGLFAGVLAIGTPTTLRFLGPEYAVPVSMALTLSVALAIVLLAPQIPLMARLITGALLMGGLVLVHPPTALVVSGFAGILLIVKFRSVRWHWSAVDQLPALAVLAVPAIWFAMLSGDLRSELLGQTSVSANSGQGLITEYLSSAGYLRLFLMSGALFFLFVSGFTAGKIGLLIGLAIALGFARAHELGFVGMANLYDRSWLYIDLLLVLGGGAGIAAAIRLIPDHRLPVTRPVLLNAALAILVLIVVGGVLISRSGDQVYRIGETTRIADFQWINDNLDHVNGLSLLDPDTAIGYPSIAGRPVFASSAFPRPSNEERVERALGLLANSPDVHVLADLGIGIVYQPTWNGSPGLTEVRTGIYVVEGSTNEVLQPSVSAEPKS